MPLTKIFRKKKFSLDASGKAKEDYVLFIKMTLNLSEKVFYGLYMMTNLKYKYILRL